MQGRVAVWGPDLSPFVLKVWALLEAAGVPFERLPAHGSRWRNLRVSWRIERAKRRGLISRWDGGHDLDEYPLVPFLLEDDRRIAYDSSAIARRLDAEHPPVSGPLYPDESALGFVTRLLDEAFDEFGLYMVHHHRWVTSAATNDAGERLARQMRTVLPPGTGRLVARRFSARQVRRLPYLFSVAPPGHTLPLPTERVPPARPGFPPTHALLDETWLAHLDAMETGLGVAPFLLGERFTVADASAYGQLSMNLTDPTANERLRARAPRTHAWLLDVRDGRHVGCHGNLALHDSLRPLLRIVAETFVPLMHQNEAAHDAARVAGETLFNERAFDRGRTLYDGMLRGHRFRAVVKTFQVRVWRDLVQAWRNLDAADRRHVDELAGGLGMPD
jgi:glutathione S-transferase